MASEAVFGLVGVLVGSMTTAVVTIYSEQLASRREIAQRDRQFERERRTARDVFQRDSVLTLQSAASDLLKAVYDEQDRLLAVAAATGQWQQRAWETPTALGWSAALLTLESSRARVFDDELRSVADELRETARRSIWAESHEMTKHHGERLHPLMAQLNARVTRVLPSLY